MIDTGVVANSSWLPNFVHPGSSPGSHPSFGRWASRLWWRS